MTLLRPPITVGDDAWVAADAFVGPGVTIGARTLLGARSSAFSDLPADVVRRRVRRRGRSGHAGSSASRARPDARLQVISGIEPENGGPTAALVGHCRALAAAGAATSVVATWKLPSSFALADETPRRRHSRHAAGPDRRRRFRRHPDTDAVLRDAIAGHDVVHVHAVWESIEHRAAVLARRAGVPYVWTPHGMLDEWNMRRNGWFQTRLPGPRT